MAGNLEAYSLRQIERLCHQHKAQKRGWYHLHRRISTPITWVLYRWRVSPNTISASMLLVGLTGNALLVPGMLSLNILGLLLIYLAFLLDKVDGDLARLQECVGPRAMILDYAYHRITLFTFYAALGGHAYLAGQGITGLVAGFAAGFLANYAQDAQLYPYRIYAQKVLCMREGWMLDEASPQQRREPRESRVKLLKVFTSQLLLLVPTTLLIVLAPQWLDALVLTAVGALIVFLAVQHFIIFHGGMEAELAYIDSCLRQRTASPDVAEQPRRGSATLTQEPATTQQAEPIAAQQA